MQPPYPKTRVDTTVDTVHGVKVADPYRWLEDQNSPETRAWIEEQSKYTHAMLDGVAGRERISARLRELTHRETISTPLSAAGLYVFMRRLPERNQADVYIRRGLQGKDELLIDANELSPDHTKSVSLLSLSQDGRLLAYGIRTGGEDEVVLKIHDFQLKKDLTDDFPRARYESVAFRSGAAGFYYAILHGKRPPHPVPRAGHTRDRRPVDLRREAQPFAGSRRGERAGQQVPAGHSLVRRGG